jgi:hypothetical protein
MKARLILSLLLALISLKSYAQELAKTLEEHDSNEDSSWYIGAALGALTYQQTNLRDFRVDDQRLILGKQLNRTFALEMQVGNGSSDTQLVSGVPVRLAVNNYVAGFLKANATFTAEDWSDSRFRVYGMLGGTRVQTTSTDPVTTSSGTQTSVSAGVGMEFFHDNIGIQLGYTRYVSGSANNHKYSLDSLHLGVIYQFGSDKVANGN